MDVMNLTRVYELEILELTQAGPEMIKVEHRPDIWMPRITRKIQRGLERSDERGSAHEFHHHRNVEWFNDIACLAKIVLGAFVIVDGEFFARIGGADQPVDSQLGSHLANPL